MSFTEQDIKQIKENGLAVNQVNKQVSLFKKGLPYINIHSAATINHGILKLSDNDQNHYLKYFDENRIRKAFIKFVPASGAATRMFKFLFDFLGDFKPDEETIDTYVNQKSASDLSVFHVGIKKFPFYKKVKQQLYNDYKDFDDLTINHQLLLFVKSMIDEDKLNYGNSPKGLLPFHQYKDNIVTAFEEHLYESALYASTNNKADLHFTISEQHNQRFKEEFKRIEEFVQRETNTKFNITYSFQKHSTDTIAVTPKNEPFRDENGSLLFRPSGHGALLENLNQLNTDVIFIKNIDNVVTNKFVDEVAKYKKLLAGILLEVQEQAFKYQEDLDDENISEAEIYEIARFLSNKLNVVINTGFENYSKKYQIEYLQKKLNKPIRVCGMVKNEGEPGGGPFWVKEESGTISLQIVESAQIDTNIKQQGEIFKKSTHFNPVDLVCGVKNYKGEKYDLSKYVNPNTAFITLKNKAGKDLKALELPGLWNGSMAFWNTIFVEVPLITFNPVKTVNDLLKDAHQTS